MTSMVNEFSFSLILGISDSTPLYLINKVWKNNIVRVFIIQGNKKNWSHR